MKRPDNVSCENCVYYSSSCCHLGPPTVIPRVDNTGDYLLSDAQTAWPMVDAKSFCGEFSDIWESDDLGDDDGDILETEPAAPGGFPPFPPAP